MEPTCDPGLELAACWCALLVLPSFASFAPFLPFGPALCFSIFVEVSIAAADDEFIF